MAGDGLPARLGRMEGTDSNIIRSEETDTKVLTMLEAMRRGGG